MNPNFFSKTSAIICIAVTKSPFLGGQPHGHNALLQLSGWLGRRSTSPHVWYRNRLPESGLRVRECLTLRFLRHKAEMSKRSSKKWPAASPEEMLKILASPPRKKGRKAERKLLLVCCIRGIWLHFLSHFLRLIS